MRNMQSPVDGVFHSAVQHPVYSDHYVTGCGMVVTTSETRHEANLTGFIMCEPMTKITCTDCGGEQIPSD